MIRFHITFTKVGAIFDPQGMAERLVALSDNSLGQLVIYVTSKNKDKFEKLLDGHDEVLEYNAHPVDLESRVEAAVAARGKSK